MKLLRPHTLQQLHGYPKAYCMAMQYNLVDFVYLFEYLGPACPDKFHEVIFSVSLSFHGHSGQLHGITVELYNCDRIYSFPRIQNLPDCLVLPCNTLRKIFANWGNQES